MKRDYCTLTCSDREQGDNPHAVRIALDLADARRLFERGNRELERGDDASAIGDYVIVTDQSTGKRYRVASHPCQGGCRCALVALEAT